MTNEQDPFDRQKIAVKCPDNKQGCLVAHYEVVIPAKEIIKTFVGYIETRYDKERHERYNLIIDQYIKLEPGNNIYTGIKAFVDRLDKLKIIGYCHCIDGIKTIYGTKEFKALKQLVEE